MAGEKKGMARARREKKDGSRQNKKLPTTNESF
jgi:hypothetical protein